jgi:hypothetical protein
MATGIFSTTRVAGEGVALAVVMAVLASVVDARIRQTGAGRLLSEGDARDLAARLAAGDLVQAQRWAPSIPRALLVQQYDEAFRILLLVLSAITLTAAVVTFLCLSPRRVTGRRPAHSDG